MLRLYLLTFPLGWAQLEANPELRGVVTAGGNVLPQAVIEEAFADQYGRTLNFKSFRGALGKLNSWYEERGIFGQVAPPPLFKTPLPPHPTSLHMHIAAFEAWRHSNSTSASTLSWINRNSVREPRLSC